MKKLITVVLMLLVMLMLVLVPAASVSGNPGLGIVGLWHLDTVDDTADPHTTPDSSGQGHTGSLYPIDSEPILVVGKFGNALSFDCLDDYVDLGSVTGLPLTNTGYHTVELWVKGNSSNSHYEIPISLGNNTLIVGTYNNKIACTRLLNSVSYSSISAGTYDWSVWHHLVFVYDGSQLYDKIYVDGVDVTIAWNNFWGQATTDKIVLGYDLAYPGGWGGYLLRWNGLIDEVRVWNVALTASQIEYNYNLREIGIDIKPGSETNSINLGSNGVVPVAILGSETFDASTVDPSTVRLAGAAARLKGKSGNCGSLQDVNSDGYLDLVVQVYTEQLGLSAGVMVANLTAYTYVGPAIAGSDSVNIVPPE